MVVTGIHVNSTVHNANKTWRKTCRERVASPCKSCSTYSCYSCGEDNKAGLSFTRKALSNDTMKSNQHGRACFSRLGPHTKPQRLVSIIDPCVTIAPVEPKQCLQNMDMILSGINALSRIHDGAENVIAWTKAIAPTILVVVIFTRLSLQRANLERAVLRGRAEGKASPTAAI